MSRCAIYTVSHKRIVLSIGMCDHLSPKHVQRLEQTISVIIKYYTHLTCFNYLRYLELVPLISFRSSFYRVTISSKACVHPLQTTGTQHHPLQTMVGCGWMVSLRLYSINRCTCVGLGRAIQMEGRDPTCVCAVSICSCNCKDVDITQTKRYLQYAYILV